MVLRLAPLTLVRSGLVSDAASTRALIRQGLDDPTWWPSADDVLGIAYALLARGDIDMARSMVERFEDDLSRTRPRKYQAVASWLDVARAGHPLRTQALTHPSCSGTTEVSTPWGSPRSIAAFIDSLTVIVAFARVGANLRSRDDAVQSVCDQVVGACVAVRGCPTSGP